MSGPWEDYESGPWDDYKTDAPKGASSVGMYEKANSDLLDTAQGVWDVGANMLGQGVGSVVSGLGMLGQAPFLGIDEAVKRHKNRMETTFTAEPTSETGKRYNENTGKFLEDYLVTPLRKGAEGIVPALPLRDEIVNDPNFKEFFGQAVGEAMANFLPLGSAGAAAKGVAKAIKKSPSSGSLRLDALDTIKKPTPLPQQQGRPTWMERQLELGENLEAREQSFADRNNIQGELDLRPREFPVDENGMPVNMARSLDAQEATNPRQVDLFDEEFRARGEELRAQQLAEQQAREAQTPVPERNIQAEIDEAYNQRQQQLFDEQQLAKQETQNDKLTELEQQLRESAYKPQGTGQGPKTRAAIPRRQRGAIGWKQPNNKTPWHDRPEPSKFDRNESLVDYYRSLRDNNVYDASTPTDIAFKAALDLGTPQQRFLLRALAREDFLGFDYPHQAIKALIEEPEAFDLSPTLKGALTKFTNKTIVGPKSQRGGLDAKSIGEAIKTAVNVITPKILKANTVQVPKVAGEVVNKVPGIDRALKDYIPEDPTPDSIIGSALQEQDSGLKVRGVQSGATLTATKTGSTIIKGVGRLYQNAGKRAELNVRENVLPVEKLFKGLNKKEVWELGETLKREMFDGRVFTLEDLQQAGYSPKQIEVYESFRTMQEKAFEVQNASLVSQGRKPLTKQEAYLSSRWSGDWHIPVYEGNKLVWYIAEKSKLRAEKALQYLQAQGVDVNTKLSKVKYKTKGGKEKGDVQDAYQTMLSLLDPDDPRVASLKSIAEDMMASDAHLALGQSKHFKNKANIRGFVGDRPWHDPMKEAFDMFKEQFAYTKSAMTWSELQKATKTAKEVLNNEKLIESQPNNLEYARQYAKNQIGFGENQYIAGLENQLAELTSHWLPADRQSFYQVLGGAKTFFLATKLGFNTGYALANLVQPIWTNPWHVDLTAKGFKHNPAMTFAKGEMDSSAGFLNSQLGTNLPMSPLGKEALKYAEANGIINRSIYDEAQGLGNNRFLEAANNAASKSIAGVEHYARLKAFMGFVHHLEQSKAFKDNIKLFEKAEEYTTNAMVDYRRGERPMAFEQGGLVGNALSTLQTFKFNYYNQLHYFSQQAVKGNWKPLAAFLGTQAAVGGVLSMPFLQEIDDAWQTIKSWLPDSVHEPVKDLNIKEKMIETIPDWATFGGMSKLTGANMSSRFDSGNLADFSFDGLFPFITDLYKQGSAVAGFASKPNETSFAQMAHRVAPPGPIKGLVETKMDTFKSPNGASYNPNNLVRRDADYVRTPEQETYKQFGVTELSESKFRDKRYRQVQDEKQIQTRMEKNQELFYDAVVRKSPSDIKTYAKRYINYGGNPENLNAIIEREAIKGAIPKIMLDRIRASTLGAVQEVKRMKNATTN